MFESLGSLLSAFKLPDLRRRILYVFGIFGLFVVGLHIPVPNIDRAAMERLVTHGGTLFGLFDVFSGGAFRKFSVFAMSITPYINASIIFQLLGVASDRVKQLVREGASGQRKISQYTRYLTIALAFVQAFGLCSMLRSGGILQVTSSLQILPIAITLTAGTACLMWMANQITDKGIGNGVSLIIFVGICARLPVDVNITWRGMLGGAHSWYNVLALVSVFVATVMAIIYMQQGQRKIPIQHAKRVVGTRVYGGASTSLPLRVNTAGVIPIIFAISLSLLPAQVFQFAQGFIREDWRPAAEAAINFFTPGSGAEHASGSALYFVLVVLFTYFYTAIVMNVPELTDNMKKTGSYVPGIRPGRPTADYIDRVLTRITLAGAVFLGVIALLQYYVPGLTGVRSFSLVGGTSLLIVVGVALETMLQIEAHLVMRHYEGFIK
jgi:preprotein translocase subunit SecY